METAPQSKIQKKNLFLEISDRNILDQKPKYDVVALIKNCKTIPTLFCMQDEGAHRILELLCDSGTMPHFLKYGQTICACTFANPLY